MMKEMGANVKWKKTEQAWLSSVRHRLVTFEDSFQKHADLCTHCYALIIWSLEHQNLKNAVVAVVGFKGDRRLKSDEKMKKLLTQDYDQYQEKKIISKRLEGCVL